MSQESDNKDSIERLNERLYSRGQSSDPREEGKDEENFHFTPKTEGLKNDWRSLEKADFGVSAQNNPPNSHNMSFLKKVLIAAIVFFVFSAGLAAYVIFGGQNVVSAKNVDIKITAPVSVAGGDEFPMEINLINNNGVNLQNVSLLIEYPSGTRKFGENASLARYRESIGDVLAGQSVVKKVSAVLYGQEGDKKDINVSVEYRIANSNAVLAKSVSYETSISSSPISIFVNSLKETSSGQNIEISIDVVSNSSSVIKNVLFRADYPYGFTFKNAAVRPTYDNNIWSLGDFRLGSKTTIKIDGELSGQEGDDKTFKFTLGSEDPNNEKTIDVVFLDNLQTITITKPFVGVSMALNNDATEPYIGRGGKNIQVDLSWVNNLLAAVTDAKVEVKLLGNIFDRYSVSAGSGFYRSIDNTIVWDQSNNQSFANLKPGDSGHLNFSFNLLPTASDLGTVRNPGMELDVNVSGRRSTDASIPQDIISTVVRTIKVSSDLGLVSKAVYSSGPFNNSGPIPPRADKQTTYTIVWTLTNTSNLLSNTKVSAVLPGYVNWLGSISPSGENVSYDNVSRQIIWNAGDVKAGSGYDSSAREMAFQISFTPSVSQIGSIPNILGETVAEAVDKFTGATIKSNVKSALTTDLSNDYGAGSGGGVVGR